MIQQGRTILSGMKVLLMQQGERQWVDNHAVVIENGLIKAIVPNEMIKHHLPAQQCAFPSDYFLAPGFIDLHIHGANGKDVMDGSSEAYDVISRALAAEGVTGFLATTMTAPKEQLDTALAAIAAAMKQCSGATILGVHLEGPFIASAKRGAQHGANMLKPDIALIKHWQHLTDNAIKIVTLAPELPGVIDLIHALRSMNIIASAGHTDATFDETEAAIAAGCTQATHLFNAMRGLHQREAGAVGALLLSDKVMAELIVDGLHLCPAIVELALRVKGGDRLCLVTDAMRGKCLGDGHYDLGGQAVEVRQGRAELPDGTLAGSTLRMPDAIKNMAQFTRCGLPDAIAMATENPAVVLGLEAKKGSIEVGKDADLVILDAAWNVMVTMVEGREVYSRECS